MKLLLVGLTLVVLMCSGVMFLAGNDIWHALGRPDIWNMTEPLFADARAFMIAFYLQWFLLLTQFVLLLAQVRRGLRVRTTETVEA